MPFARGIDHVANFLTSRSNAIATCLKNLNLSFRSAGEPLTWTFIKLQANLLMKDDLRGWLNNRMHILKQL
jgi:hypothetical protein